MMRWFTDWRLLATIVVSAVLISLPAKYSFLTSWTEHELFDNVSRVHENIMVGNAPPVVMIPFDRESREAWWTRKRGESSRVNWPAVAPFEMIEELLSKAKEGCTRLKNRACPAVILVDIDIVPAGASRDPAEVAELARFLMDWAKTPGLPLVAFVRAPSELVRQSENEPARFELGADRVLDPIIERAPNLVWASGLAQADEDAVVRSFGYFVCVSKEKSNNQFALPHAALYALAMTEAGDAAKAKASVRAAMTGSLCPVQADSAVRFRLPVPGANDKSHAFKGQFGLVVYHLTPPRKERPAPMITHAGPWQGTPTITVIPQHILSIPGATLDSAKNAIVVVSAEEPSFEDTHWTPYGPFMGALIVANAARGLVVEGPTKYIDGWPRFLLVILSALLVHGCITLAEHGHHRALIRPGKGRTPLGDIARMATSRIGAFLLVGVLIFLAKRFLGLAMPSLGIWQTLGVAFVVTGVYLFFEHLDDAYEGRKDVAHK